MRRRPKSGVACLVLWLTVALSREDKSFPSENNALLESLSEEGIIFFSDDEEHERIIAALAASSDGTSSTREETTNSIENKLRHKRTNDPTENYASKPAKPKAKRQFATKTTTAVVQQAKTQPTYAYHPLPEIYRVKPHATTDIRHKLPKSPPIPVAPSSTQQSVRADEESFYTQASPWVRDFLLRHSCDHLLPVPRDFCVDNFNLMHLAPAIERIGIQSLAPDESIPASSKPFPIYRAALRLIVQDDEPEHVPVYLQNAATALFLLIHQRYAVSPRGLDLLRRRFQRGSTVVPVFGRCPRIPCSGMPLLPYADSDNLNPMEYMPKQSKVSVEIPSILVSVKQRRSKRYCALCGETFYHWESEIDGCAWGTSCGHLFWMVYGKEIFAQWLNWKPSSHSPNKARIFGFRLHPSAHLASTSTSQFNA
jgi:casein kinase II subunit beta